MTDRYTYALRNMREFEAELDQLEAENARLREALEELVDALDELNHRWIAITDERAVAAFGAARAALQEGSDD